MTSAQAAAERTPENAANVQRWYLSYALLGLVVAGVAPIVLPLLAARYGGPSAPGLVMASVNLGMLAAPLWGELADRTQGHRPIYVLGLAALAATTALFPLHHDLPWSLGTALAVGLAGSATATVATLFVTERHPRASWGARFGWLQTFFGGGQVVGLVLAGALGADHGPLTLGLAALAALLAAGMFRLVPATTQRARPGSGHPHARHGGLLLGAMMTHVHLPHLRAGLRELPGLLRAGRSSPFFVFLSGWSLANIGGAALFSFYPLVMVHVFGLGAGAASWAFAGAAALGLLLYGPAGARSRRSGPTAVYRAGLVMRLAALLFLAVVGVVPVAGRGWLAVLGFTLIVLSWSLLAVASSDLAAESSSLPQGETMGLYAASGAVSAVVGSLLGGLVAALTGYPGLLWLAVLFLAATLALTPRRRAGAAARDAGPDAKAGAAARAAQEAQR